MMAGRMSEFLSAPFKGKEVAPALGVLMPAIEWNLEEGALQARISSDDELEAASGYRYGIRTHARRTVSTKRHHATVRGRSRRTCTTTPSRTSTSCSFPRRIARRRSSSGAEFDPVKVGVDTSEKPGKFRFDTSLYGNSNAGHSFERRAPGEGRHRAAADGGGALGARRIPEVHPEQAQSGRSLRWSRGRRPGLTR